MVTITLAFSSASASADTYDVISVDGVSVTIHSNNYVGLSATFFFSSSLSSYPDGYEALCLKINGQVPSHEVSNYSQGTTWDYSTGCLTGIMSGYTSIDLRLAIANFNSGANTFDLEAVSTQSIPFSVGTDNHLVGTLQVPSSALQTNSCPVFGHFDGKINFGESLWVQNLSASHVAWRTALGTANLLANQTYVPSSLEKYFDVTATCSFHSQSTVEGGYSFSSETGMNWFISSSAPVFITEPTIFRLNKSSFRKWKTNNIVIESMSIRWTPPTKIWIRDFQQGHWSKWVLIKRKSGKFRTSVYVKANIKFQIKYHDEHGVNYTTTSSFKARVT